MARKPSAPSDFSSRALFQRAQDAIFVLNRHRRIRFVNAAFEQLTEQKSEDLYGMLCTRRRSAPLLAQTLAPPPECFGGQLGQVRRSAPPARVGPPWWDIWFLPLASAEGPLGIVGRIRVVGARSQAPPRALPDPLAALRHNLRQTYGWAELETDVAACAQVNQQIRLATQHRAPVIIVGEPGSGKRTVARIIHHDGPTAELAFLEMDAALLPDWALRRQLELVVGVHFGTVCIREPALLPRDVQARIAELIAESPASRRWLATCVGDMEHQVKSGRLAPDLFRALGVQAIRLIPLRERLDDLTRLTQRIFEQRAAGGALPTPRISEDAWALLRAYAWPGNLRELADVLNSAANHAGSVPLEPAHLPHYVRVTAAYARSPAVGETAWSPLHLDHVLEAVEKRLIEVALRKAKGNRTDAAALLGIWRPRLLRRMAALGLESNTETPDVLKEADNAPPTDRGL